MENNSIETMLPKGTKERRAQEQIAKKLKVDVVERWHGLADAIAGIIVLAGPLASFFVKGMKSEVNIIFDRAIVVAACQTTNDTKRQ